MIEPILVRCPAELKFLQPKFVSNLYRIGNNSDGGYALTVIALSNSDSFLSLGLGENWSFETAIAMINPNAAIDIYDDTVSLSFFATKAIKGLVKFLCLKDSLSNLRSRFTQLADYYKFWHQSPRNVHHKMRITKNSFCEIISSYSPEVRIGLKVDIEGSEWEILEQLAQNKSRFEFVLIEIHHFEDHEIELREFLATLDNDFVLAHLHANNFEHVGRNGFPRVFELTLLRKANARATGGNRQTLPVPNLDVPNSKNRPDFQISFD